MSAATILFYCMFSTGFLWLLFYLFVGRKQAQKAGNSERLHANSAPNSVALNPKSNFKAVGDFYDRTNADFVKVYGEVIQAFRTHDLSNLLNYQANEMKLKSGMRVLDAGCGVCGPAIFFAREYGVQVDAITASSVQREAAQKRINEAGLQNQIHVVNGDYHKLKAHFPKGEYDVVYFLESFGHSHDKALAIKSAWEMLKPGGMLYIKDLFVKVPAIEAHALEIQKNVERINEAYEYNVGELAAVLESIRKQGFILSALKTIDIPLEDFENLTISNDFQELTGIHRIDDLQAYLFPVDFFELICLKPWHDLEMGNSRYFMQNLYYLQVKGRSVESL